WVVTVDVKAAGNAVLELTGENADVGPVTGEASAAGAAPLAADPAFLVTSWQASVIALWSPTTRATGFVIDARGLVATNERTVGPATSVEVQLAPSVKVTGNVLAADHQRDVAVIRVDPGAVASARPVPLGCGQVRKAVSVGQEIFTIGAPPREQ